MTMTTPTKAVISKPCWYQYEDEKVNLLDSMICRLEDLVLLLVIVYCFKVVATVLKQDLLLPNAKPCESTRLLR